MIIKYLKVNISNSAQGDGKYLLKIEVDDVQCFTSDNYECEKPEDVSQVYVDNKESPSIFGELRKLKFEN